MQLSEEALKNMKIDIEISYFEDLVYAEADGLNTKVGDMTRRKERIHIWSYQGISGGR